MGDGVSGEKHVGDVSGEGIDMGAENKNLGVDFIVVLLCSVNFRLERVRKVVPAAIFPPLLHRYSINDGQAGFHGSNVKC
jgi:hypothetical protein